MNRYLNAGVAALTVAGAMLATVAPAAAQNNNHNGAVSTGGHRASSSVGGARGGYSGRGGYNGGYRGGYGGGYNSGGYYAGAALAGLAVGAAIGACAVLRFPATTAPVTATAAPGYRTWADMVTVTAVWVLLAGVRRALWRLAPPVSNGSGALAPDDIC